MWNLFSTNNTLLSHSKVITSEAMAAVIVICGESQALCFEKYYDHSSVTGDEFRINFDMTN